MMTEQEYQTNEISRALKLINEVESAPISERKENKKEFLDACVETPETVVERVGWLLNGSYGHGEYMIAWRDVDIWNKSKKLNIRARLFISIAAYEWMTTPRHAAEVWRALPDEIKEKINKGIDAEIDFYIKEREN